MHLLIKLMAIGTMISIPLVGCTSQKEVPNNIADKNTKIQISQPITENENTYLEEKAEEEKQDIKSAEKETPNTPVTSGNKEDAKKDTIKDATVPKDASQPITPNNNKVTDNTTTQKTLKPTTINTSSMQDAKDVVKEDPKEQQPSEIKVSQPIIYKGSAMGNDGMIDVAVTVIDEKIYSIEVLSHEDTPRIAQNAFEHLTNTIVASQKIDIDTVSGATYSSEGFLKAVKNALAK
ncbi:FMN-binding protein [Cellulosilyticum sp. I15G10I2]|uniref:FMN-binding protein n=1 Tax=Cellulosilyticum sp. I15G10I2 TaxID=1892843 RepID=UPI00085C9E5A|nr:FMN-binding protein [Cellulosilyticum sp. I15G10I2]